MPRPNPPRKRPRRRPSSDAVRADAALTKQTAQSSQPKVAATRSTPALPAATGAAAVDPEEMWSRRSYAILIALVAVIQLGITAIQWALQPSVSNGVTKGPVISALAVLNPISLAVASLIAAPIAKALTGERRPLRFIESIFVGLVAYFIWLVLAIAAGALLTAGTTSSGSGSPHATPCPATATCTPAASASPSASASSSTPAASPSASGTTTTPTGGLASSSAAVYGAFSVIDILALVGTWYLYPPLYKRMRVRRPPPAPRKTSDRARDDKKPAAKR